MKTTNHTTQSTCSLKPARLAFLAAPTLVNSISLVCRARRVANLTLGTGLLAMAAMCLAPQTMRAQGLPTLDDFSTGPMKMTQTTGVKNETKSGKRIIGGSRAIELQTNVNPYAQPVQVQVIPSKDSPSALIWSNGYNAFPRIDLFYGAKAPLNLNLTSPVEYDRLRISFAGLSDTLNFNIEVWTDGSSAVADQGCNLSGGSGFTNFTVDFPLTDFVLTGSGTIDWSDVTLIDVIFQSASNIGSPNLAITGFTALTPSDPLGTIVCGSQQ